MSHVFHQLYIHAVWATWDRQPFITPAIEPTIYAAVAQKARDLRCTPLRIGGVADHVHVLLRFTAFASIASLVGQLKGSSSHLVAHQLGADGVFKWQVGYSAFSVSPQDIERIQSYIANQKEHHASHQLVMAWELANHAHE